MQEEEYLGCMIKWGKMFIVITVIKVTSQLRWSWLQKKLFLYFDLSQAKYSNNLVGQHIDNYKKKKKTNLVEGDFLLWEYHMATVWDFHGR